MLVSPRAVAQFLNQTRPKGAPKMPEPADPLTAQALHDVYAPLHKAVPATKPRFVHYYWDGGPPVDECWMGMDDAEEMAGETVPVEVAAALCRVAVVKFALSKGWIVTIAPQDDGQYAIALTHRIVMGKGEYLQTEGNADFSLSVGDLDACLVAACLAVAEKPQ